MAKVLSSQVDIREVYLARGAAGVCGVCMRAGLDSARLAPARHTATFLALLRPRSLPAPLSLAPPTVVCSWCEAQAARALRLHAALGAAARAHRLFARLDRAGGLPGDGAAVAESAQVSALVSAARAQQALQISNVLLVDSGGVQCSAGPTPRTARAPPAAPAVAPDAAGSTWSRLDIETVVVDDDDEGAPPPQPPPPRLVPLSTLLEEDNEGINRDPLSGRGECGGGVAALLPDGSQLLARMRTRTPAGDAFLLHPVVRTAGGALAVPTLNITILNHQLDGQGEGEGEGEAHTDAVDLDGILQRKVDELKSASECKRARGDHYLVDIDMVREQMRSPSSPAGGGAPARGPLLKKGGKIDWEDKIPMDVISFMDATDPYAQDILGERMAPSPSAPSPFGVISDVRTSNSPLSPEQGASSPEQGPPSPEYTDPSPEQGSPSPEAWAAGRTRGRRRPRPGATLTAVIDLC